MYEKEITRDNILEIGKHSIDKLDYELLDRTARMTDGKTIVEIGCRYGCSSMLFGNIVKERNGKLYSIEYDPLPEWEENMKSQGIRGYINLIHTWSPWFRMVDLPTEIDYFFIDGDHRTMFCIADYVCLMPFVKVGGMIAVHDIYQPECARTVNRALDIIVEESKNLEEVERTAEGLGTVVYRKTKPFGV